MKTIYTLIWCKLLPTPHAFLVSSNQRSYQYQSYIMNHHAMSFVARGNTFDYITGQQWIDFLPRKSFLLQKLLTFSCNLKLFFLSGSQSPLMFLYDPSSWLHVTTPGMDLSWANVLITWTILTLSQGARWTRLLLVAWGARHKVMELWVAVVFHYVEKASI